MLTAPYALNFIYILLFMSTYRRFYIPGATWFFTVNLTQRHQNRLLIERIDVLRAAFTEVKSKHPFRIDGIVILPEHLHCILSLPPGDADYSTRWGLIKARKDATVYENPHGAVRKAHRTLRFFLCILKLMPTYRRFYIPGATWFFTVNLTQRHQNRLLVDRIDVLRAAFAAVKSKHPFRIDGIVILPEHLHCILSLPPGDADYSTRWGLIKGGFSRNIETGERLSKSRQKRGERGLWQRRFWDHLIRDERDFQRHLDYIHWNPVKHGWVQQVKDWPHSSFHKYVRLGLYPENWCSNVDLPDFEFGEYFP